MRREEVATATVRSRGRIDLNTFHGYRFDFLVIRKNEVSSGSGFEGRETQIAGGEIVFVVDSGRSETSERGQVVRHDSLFGTLNSFKKSFFEIKRKFINLV